MLMRSGNPNQSLLPTTYVAGAPSVPAELSRYLNIWTIKMLRNVIILLSLILSPISIIAAEDEKLSSIGWVGLWNEEMVEWAENENRMYNLCPKTMSQELYNKCKINNLAKKVWLIPAYKSPNNISEKIGVILVTVKPGSSFIASFKNKKGIERGFEPDLFEQDWGYGPYFHQTYLEIKKDWIKIPINSLNVPVWINPRGSIKNLSTIAVTKGVVYKLGDESIVIIKQEGDTVFYRKVLKSDMWCNTGTPPDITSRKIKKIKIKQLYNSNMNLLLDIKYKRGC